MGGRENTCKFDPTSHAVLQSLWECWGFTRAQNTGENSNVSAHGVSRDWGWQGLWRTQAPRGRTPGSAQLTSAWDPVHGGLGQKVEEVRAGEKGPNLFLHL